MVARSDGSAESTQAKTRCDSPTESVFSRWNCKVCNSGGETDLSSSTERSATVVCEPSLFVRHESEFSAPDSGYASSPQEALSQTNTSLISQYLEALYSTKTSLAYFAKSALARARAEFQRMKASWNKESLLSFLQNIILSEDDFNAKYENFLPGIKSDEMEKSMLAITEEERKYLIQKFWRNGGDENEVNESALQREIQELKIREYSPS